MFSLWHLLKGFRLTCTCVLGKCSLLSLLIVWTIGTRFVCMVLALSFSLAQSNLWEQNCPLMNALCSVAIAM